MTASDYNGFNISCFGGNNGSIDLTITGGTPPYAIKWSNGTITEDISDLPAGYYRVEVDDSDTLTLAVFAEITLSEPRKIEADLFIHIYNDKYNISIYGACNGMISFQAEGGIPPYNYLWNDSNTSSNRTNLCADKYYFVIEDINQCRYKSEHIALVQPDRNDWQMTGNQNVDPNTHFIGTADSSDLVFKTNNQERFRIGSNGQLTLGGEIASFGGINFGDNKTIKYQPPGGGFPGIFSIGKDPSMDPFSISNCNPLTLNSLNYQFNGIIQLYGNSYAGGNLNILELGFDGANAIIDATGMSQDPAANRLLLNYYCGRDVVVGNSTSGNFTASRDAFINNKLGVNMGGATMQKQFEVNGDVRLLATQSDENNGFEISRGLTPPVRRGISIGNDPDGSFNFYIHGYQNSSQFNFKNGFDNSNLMTITSNGHVGIGTQPSNNNRLEVCGIIKAEELTASLSWCDFVFDDNYSRMSLTELEGYLKTNKHLPYIKSGKVIEMEGLKMGETMQGLVQNLEETRLDVLDLYKLILELKNENQELKNELDLLKGNNK